LKNREEVKKKPVLEKRQLWGRNERDKGRENRGRKRNPNDVLLREGRKKDVGRREEKEWSGKDCSWGKRLG